MTQSEAFLKAMLLDLESKGVSVLEVRMLIDLVDDAFNKYQVEKDLTFEGQKMFKYLIKK